MRREAPLLAVALFIFSTALGRAEPLPADAGIVNVRDFGARGDGRSDDTDAFLRALSASGEDTGPSFWHDRIVYVPDGTYLVSAPLVKRYADGRFGSGFALIGQSRARTIIRLADNAPGYGDPAAPRAIIFTTSKHLDGTPTSGGKDYPRLGEGNDAYMNFIEDMTIDAGTANLGAIGIDFLANNIGAIRNVTIRAPPGSGATGLSMTRKWPGPALISEVSIEGFDIGLSAAQSEYGLTFEHIRLTRQSVAAIRNNGNALSMRDIRIDGPSPAILNDGPTGMIAIDEAALPAVTDRIQSAFDNKGVVRVRNVRLNPDSGTVWNGVLTGQSAWTSITNADWLPVPADAPPVPPDKPGDWHKVERSEGSVDDTQALRDALAKGGVVYLPNGIYRISESIEIPANVHRIVGMNSTVKVVETRRPGFRRDAGMFHVSSAGASISIERLAFDNSYRGRQVAIEVSGARDVTIRDSVAAGVTLLDRHANGGRVFIENTCCGLFEIAGPAGVYARQLNTEGGGTRIVNKGSPLWILGIKTEGIVTVVRNEPNARTDIFGGLIYMVRDRPAKPVPAFQSTRGHLSATFVEESLRPQSRYGVYVAPIGESGGRTIDADGFPARGYGRFVPDLIVTPQTWPDHGSLQ